MVADNNLQKIRWELNLSLREMSKLCGVSYSTIYKTENFINDPTQSVIRKIARGLNMPVTEIFNFY